MKTRTLLVIMSAMVLSILTSTGLFVGSSFAQENMTNSTSETGEMMGNETNQTEQGGGNETQQGPLERLGETLGGIFGGGN